MDNTDYRLMQIIEDIQSVADDMEKKHHYDCQIALAEALCIIQEKLTDEEKKLYKLDYDIEKRYY